VKPLNQPLLTVPKFPREWVLGYLPAALVAFYFGYLALLPAVGTRWLDFPVYWDAGKKALLGVTVYDVSGHFQYKYSPFFALIFGKVFESVSFEAASVFFSKAMLLLWLVLFLRFARRDFRSVLVAILFFGNALRLDLELGQINALVLFILTLLFGALERERSWPEDLPFGFLFSFAVQLKLFALILIPLLILRREWRKLGLGLALLPLLSIGGVAVEHGWTFALAENRAWIASLRDSTGVLLFDDQNVAALGTFGKILGATGGKIAWLIAGMAFAVYLWRNRARPVGWFRDWLLYAVAIFNPLVWSYWILYALPLFSSRLPDFEGAFRRRSRAARIYGGIAAFFIFFAFNGQHARWAWNGGIFVGLLFLAVAAGKVRTRFKDAKTASRPDYSPGP
jgi:hypothetical protein